MNTLPKRRKFEHGDLYSLFQPGGKAVEAVGPVLSSTASVIANT